VIFDLTAVNRLLTALVSVSSNPQAQAQLLDATTENAQFGLIFVKI